jgi:hypothetical protein
MIWRKRLIHNKNNSDSCEAGLYDTYRPIFSFFPVRPCISSNKGMFIRRRHCYIFFSYTASLHLGELLCRVGFQELSFLAQLLVLHYSPCLVGNTAFRLKKGETWEFWIL